MSNTFKHDFTYHWGLATCTLEDDERVIANEKLEKILQSDLFKEDEKSETDQGH
jgi:hypothetical protein